MSVLSTGYLTLDEIKAAKDYASEERMAKGPVAVAECIQEIPCNPCESACKFGAIHIGEQISNLPCINEEKCTGCGMCIAQCSGMAIFVLDKSLGDGMGSVAFPYEYLPLPEKGQIVKAVDRQGHVVCNAEVLKVLNPASFDRTPVVTIKVPVELVDEVRGCERVPRVTVEPREGEAVQIFDDDMLVCRCEEVTVSEIVKAIEDGAKDVTGVKRRTRAGMGLCQGRTCEKMVQAILRMTGGTAEDIDRHTARPPVRPVTFGSIAGGEDNE